MHLSIVEKNIIALHYYFPAPMNRYRALLRVDPELQHISSMPTSQLATLLNLPFDKAHHLKLCLEEYTVTQLCEDRKSTRLNSSHVSISYAVFCLKKKKNNRND